MTAGHGRGYTGVLREVDLSTATIRTEELPQQEWRRYVGGGLLGVRRMLTHTRTGVDPLEPDALLMFLSSVVMGHRAVGLPKFTMVAKSPMTGGIGEARVTGPFGVALKSSGCEGISVRGRAQAPSYLLVDGPAITVLDADDLWGMPTHTATDMLKQRHGDHARVAVIGPAGERLIRYASVLTEWAHPAARMGFGAVMGSKNLKAVVILDGAHLPPVHDPVDLARIGEEYRAGILTNPLTAAQASATEFGGWFLDSNLLGYAGVGNFQTSRMPEFDVDAGDQLAGLLTVAEGECPGCPNNCIKRYANGVDGRLGGLDEEGLAALALGCRITDVADALDVHARCHAHGIDPVSLAGVWAMVHELGREEGVLEMMDKLVAGEPGYTELGDGTARLADKLGVEAPAMHVKGLEMGRYDPRVSAGQALAYAVSPLGPRYEIVEHDIDFDPIDGPPHGLTQMAALGTYDWEPMATLDATRVARTVSLLDLWSGLDALGVCLFAGPPMRELTQRRVTRLVQAVTGWMTADSEVLLWGRRRWNLMRLYNQREGIGSDADRLPDRFFDEKVDVGRHRGAALDRTGFADALQLYYELAGWDSNGVPKPSTLTALGIEWALSADAGDMMTEKSVLR
jgi:aldehyde:ferredoxin oxidoreductase